MINSILTEVAENIEIPKQKHKEAMDRFDSVEDCLKSDRKLLSLGDLHIYLQGSFRLDTVVRPIKKGAENNYDIDLVCELDPINEDISPRTIKKAVGDCLKQNSNLKKLLDREGKRCWTLQYKEQDGIGFHLDVLPAVSNSTDDFPTSIAITTKRPPKYRWSLSGPESYAKWFQKHRQVRTSFHAYEYWYQNSPINNLWPYIGNDYTVDRDDRTPLQQSIQILKRHRDMTFNNANKSDYPPISIIITTLATQLYSGQNHLFSTLTDIVKKMHRVVEYLLDAMDGAAASGSDLIQYDASQKKWYIPNPIDEKENFADRWHEDNNARAFDFFKWVYALKRDLVDRVSEYQSAPDALRQHLATTLAIKGLCNAQTYTDKQNTYVAVPYY